MSNIEDPTESLRAAERRLQAAQLTSDIDALNDLLHDSLRFTGPDGSLYTKQDDLRMHETGHQVLTRVEEEDLQVLATEHTCRRTGSSAEPGTGKRAEMIGVSGSAEGR